VPRSVNERGRRFPRWVVQVVVGTAVGLALGFAIGWWLWPVQYTNTAPDVLRQDYRDDYIVMTAEAYEIEGNLEQARARLELLDPERPAAPVIDLLGRLIEAGGSAKDITRLVRLARDLGASTPVLPPHIEEQL
jgi:hypothetical protein